MNALSDEWHATWAALRLRGIAMGNIMPDADEPFDLLLLWALRLPR